MICPLCRFPHVAALHPSFSFTAGWFGRVHKVQSGEAVACWNCGTDFIVTTRGETLRRDGAGQPQIAPNAHAVPSLVPRKGPEPPPAESLLDQDMPAEPKW